jgi:hypothetical protein
MKELKALAKKILEKAKKKNDGDSETLFIRKGVTVKAVGGKFLVTLEIDRKPKK